jgi:hypothetical protein
MPGSDLSISDCILTHKQKMWSFFPLQMNCVDETTGKFVRKKIKAGKPNRVDSWETKTKTLLTLLAMPRGRHLFAFLTIINIPNSHTQQKSS